MPKMNQKVSTFLFSGDHGGVLAEHYAFIAAESGMNLSELTIAGLKNLTVSKKI